jgi:hypothetical protein
MFLLHFAKLASTSQMRPLRGLVFLEQLLLLGHVHLVLRRYDFRWQNLPLLPWYFFSNHSAIFFATRPTTLVIRVNNHLVFISVFLIVVMVLRLM